MALETSLIRNTVAHYGARKTQMQYGGQISSNFKRTTRHVFKYNELPDAASHNLDLVIPAGSTILSAKLRIIDAFVSTSTTTDLTVGLQTSAGAEIDDDGLITAAQATQTTIGVAGAIIDGASGTPGALIGKTIGAANGELVVTPTVADLTAGRAEMIIEYLLPVPAQQV